MNLSFYSWKSVSPFYQFVSLNPIQFWRWTNNNADVLFLSQIVNENFQIHVRVTFGTMPHRWHHNCFTYTLVSHCQSTSYNSYKTHIALNWFVQSFTLVLCVFECAYVCMRSFHYTRNKTHWKCVRTGSSKCQKIIDLNLATDCTKRQITLFLLHSQFQFYVRCCDNHTSRRGKFRNNESFFLLRKSNRNQTGIIYYRIFKFILQHSTFYSLF